MTQSLDVPSFSQRAPALYYAPRGAAPHAGGLSDGGGEDVDYLSVIRRLWRRKFLILGLTALVTAASAAVVAVLPRHYVAHALVVVENPNAATSFVLVENNANKTAALPPPDAETVQTEAQILQSPELAEEVIRNLNLENNREFNPAVGETPASPTTKEDAENSLAQTVKNFLARLHVERKGQSRVIDVAFDAPQPKLAATIANAIIDQYIADQEHMRANTVKDQMNWLHDRIDSLQAQTTADEQAIVKFKAQADLFTGPQGTPLRLKEMAQVADALARAKADRITLEDRLHQLRGALSSNLNATSDLLDSEVMTKLRTEEAALEGQLAHESQQFKPAYPSVAALSAQIAELKSEMKHEAQRITAALENKLDVARMQEQQLNARLDGLKQEVTKMNNADAPLAALQRQAEADRLVLSNYLARYKEVGQEGGRSGDFQTSQVVSYAQMPLSPTQPRSLLLIAVAATCSLIGSCSFILFRDKTDPTFRSVEDLERAVGINGLGLTPLIDGATHSFVVISKYGSETFYREAVKGIYTRHFLLLGRESKTTVVTSAFPNEGKTALALSLATVAAQGGHRTILVDADFWRGGAIKALGLRWDGAGLADVLASKADLADVLLTHSTSGIDILPPGKFSRTSGLAHLDNLPHVLELLASRYEFVIIDSPPVFAVSEALVLAARASETIVAVRWSSTPRTALALALRRLREAGANVAGTVLTFVDQRQHASYGYAESAYFSKEVVSYYSRSGALSAPPGSSRAEQSDAVQKMRHGGPQATLIALLTKCGQFCGGSRIEPECPRIASYDKPRRALLVIDVQPEFTEVAKFSTARTSIPELIDVVNDTAGKARDGGVVVVYAQQQFGGNRRRRRSRWPFGGQAKEHQAEPDPRLRRVSGHSFPTPGPNAFSNLKFDAFLRKRCVDHLFLMGIDGSKSVSLTASTARKRGYTVTLIGDAILTTAGKKWARKLKDFAENDVFAIASQEFRDLLDIEASFFENAAERPRREHAM